MDSFPEQPSVPSDSSALDEALAKKRPRFFRASGGSARGKSGKADTERFADELMLLQECSQLAGERLGMNSISYAVIYDNDDTSAYHFDENNQATPQIVGALANRRLPMHELLASLEDFLNE